MNSYNEAHNAPNFSIRGLIAKFEKSLIEQKRSNDNE